MPNRLKLPFQVMIKPRGPICNLDCEYCYYLRKERLYPPGEQFRLSLENLELFIRDYIAAQPGPEVVISWQGGEPTLMGLDFFRKAVEFQHKYLPTGWKCTHSFQTNGTLLDDEWCRFFKENDFLVGISIDGPEHIHDHFRRDKGGNPTHARVMQGLRLLQKHEVDVNILCVINSYNALYPKEVYRFFRESGVGWIQFIPIVERTENGGVTDRTVPPQAFGEFMASVFDEWVRHDVGRLFVQWFEEAVAVWLGYPPSLCIFTETCGRALVMEHNGDLYSCDHFVDPPYKLGNVYTTPLAEMVESPAQVQFGLDKRDKLPEYCRQCDVYFICHGACPKDRFATASNGEPGLNYLCEGYRHFFRHIDPVMRRLAQLIRQGYPAPVIMDVLREEDERRWTSVHRNDPCPCGSGLKFKKCCLRKRQTARSSVG
jgi:uncharacterized protein